MPLTIVVYFIICFSLIPVRLKCRIETKQYVDGFFTLQSRRTSEYTCDLILASNLMPSIVAPGILNSLCNKFTSRRNENVTGLTFFRDAFYLIGEKECRHIPRLKQKHNVIIQFLNVVSYFPFY